MEVVKITTPEYVSKDIFEEDFLRTFLVIYRLQYLMGSCRIDMKNRFAMPTTSSQRSYTIFCIILTALSNCALTYSYIMKMKHSILRCLSFSSLSLQFITFVLNIIHVRFVNNDKNVEFYVKMQKIDRLLKINRWKIFNEWVRKLTNGPILVVVMVFFVISILAFIERGLISILFIGAAYCSLVLILEIIACSTVIAYFVFRMRFINSLMENHLEKENISISEPVRRIFSIAYIKHYAQKTQNYYESSETNIYLREIFKCFTMYQDLYKFQLFIFCLQCVVKSLITFEILLYSIQKSESTALEMVSSAVFFMSDVFAAIFLALRYEMFFHEVRRTKRLCINVMARHVEGPLREKARKMLKMIDETPPRFSVYEMWEMSAATFVSMFSLITSLIVTLLQFAFL